MRVEMLHGRYGMTNLKEAYSGKTVLVTGHTGFKGSWLSLWLNHLGAKVVGYALDPVDEKCNFNLSHVQDKVVDIRGDINDLEHMRKVFTEYQPDFVFHLAAQPLVLESYRNPVYTFQTNLVGTVNVLECIRHLEKPCVGVMITTDKVYENHEDGRPFKEDDKFGGYDPYSASKATCEIAISSYRLSFMNPNDYDTHHKVISSVRAGNVIGGGDFAMNRIVPDFMKAIEKKETIVLRNPKSVRPWEFVLEPLYGYLLVGAKCLEDPMKYGTAFNFGPDAETIRSVEDLVNELKKHFDEVKVEVQHNENAPHEAELLLLDASKAKNELGWNPKYNFEDTIKVTATWYKEYHDTDPYELCIRQIEDYMKE